MDIKDNLIAGVCDMCNAFVLHVNEEYIKQEDGRHRVLMVSCKNADRCEAYKNREDKDHAD